MLPGDAQIISVDDHVIEHPRVWSDRMPSKYKDVAPRIVRGADGNDFWLYEGAQAGNFSLNAVAGKDSKDIALDPRTYDDMLAGCYDIRERIHDMDVEGVWAQLCFPNMAGFAGKVFRASKDPELGLASLSAYNDFILDEWCAYNPERQIPLGLVPYWDIDACLKEMRRTADKGIKSWSFPELPDRIGLPSWHTDHWDPILAFAQETNIPFSLHFGSGGPPLVSPEGSGVFKDGVLVPGKTNFTIAISLYGLNSESAMVELVLSPVFHKFPGVRMALSEGGIGWMPYILERMDFVWERHRWYNAVNREVKPSDIARDHIWGCFISDNAGIEARARIGVENIMFESDYPHSDSQWPHTRKLLAETMLNGPDDEARKMAEDNARKFYNFPRVS
jgi:predicted TIM-barrel fold metal-dependent hydrolase